MQSIPMNLFYSSLTNKHFRLESIKNCRFCSMLVSESGQLIKFIYFRAEKAYSSESRICFLIRPTLIDWKILEWIEYLKSGLFEQIDPIIPSEFGICDLDTIE